MRNILLTISYDGSDFCGWQRQDKADNGRPVRTVQGEIERVLTTIHKGPITLYGSGRTDSGVHARGQAANFISTIDSIPYDHYPLALNALLPKDIRVMGARIVGDDFSARYNATSRVYRYYISPRGNIPLAYSTRYLWQVNCSPDIERLNKLCTLLLGERDYASFASSIGGGAPSSTSRYIDRAKWFYEGALLVFEIEGNAFLWKMVRTLVGTLLDLSQKYDTPLALERLQSIFLARDRRSALTAAPPQGLFLWEVRYDGVRRHP